MPRPAWIVVAVLFGASPGAAGPPLSAVAEEAAKPPEEQKVVGKEEPSETKHKEEAPAAETRAPQSSGAVPLDTGGAVGAVAPGPYLPPSGIASMGIVDPDAVPTPPRTRWRFGAVAGGLGLAADSFGAIGSGGILVGLGSGLVSFDVRGHYSRGRFAGGIERAFTNLQGISGDAVARIRLSGGEFAAVHVNLMLMARLGRYAWDFRNPVQVAEPDGVRTYDHDSIRYRAFMAGLGVVPLSGWEWSLQLTAAGGHQRFQGETGAGFTNDLFENGPVGEVVAEVVYSPF